MQKVLRSTHFAVLAPLLLVACVGGSTADVGRDKEALKAYILDAPPPDVGAKLDVDFDGKVRLLGAKVEPTGALKPGQKVKLTLYWRSDAKLDEGWNLFTHVVDGSGERILNIDNVGPLREWRETRQALPPSAWDQGKIYVDEQNFEIPAGVRTAKISIVSGVWKDAGRLAIKSGPKDGDNRALVATLTIDGAGKEPPKVAPRLPELRTNRVAKNVKITLDGKLDEKEWADAANSGPFIDVGTGLPATASRIQGDVKLFWTEEALYLGFTVKDPDVVGGFPKDAKDPHLWTKDCVEIMVDPDGDGDNKDYYEIQVNPQGLVFDSQFDDYNQPKKEPDGPFGHQEWQSGIKAGIVVNGTLDKADDKDEGWIAELKLPWKSFGKAKQTPPDFGSNWRFNFYAMENNGGVAWSPILRQGNFHKASRFGRISFGEAGQPLPAASGSAAPGASAAPPGSTSPASSAAPAGSAKPGAGKRVIPTPSRSL